MPADDAIWDELGTLTCTHDERKGVELPPSQKEQAAPRPLRKIFSAFVAASPTEREKLSLIVENGQAFSSADISKQVQRPDSPFRKAGESYFFLELRHLSEVCAGRNTRR